jgi:hypothetical protein
VCTSNCQRSSVSPDSTDLIARTKRLIEDDMSHSMNLSQYCQLIAGEMNSVPTLDLGQYRRQVLFEVIVTRHQHRQPVLLDHTVDVRMTSQFMSGIQIGDIPEVI